MAHSTYNTHSSLSLKIHYSSICIPVRYFIPCVSSDVAWINGYSLDMSWGQRRSPEISPKQRNQQERKRQGIIFLLPKALIREVGINDGYRNCMLEILFKGSNVSYTPLYCPPIDHASPMEHPPPNFLLVAQHSVACGSKDRSIRLWRTPHCLRSWP